MFGGLGHTSFAGSKPNLRGMPQAQASFVWRFFSCWHEQPTETLAPSQAQTTNRKPVAIAKRIEEEAIHFNLHWPCNA